MVEIVDDDDETRSLPSQEINLHLPDQKGCKRELEDEDSNPEPCKKKRAQSEDEDDGKLCPICLDVWSNSGEHRVCSIKCGHLFGHSCLQQWLNSQTSHHRTCPTCKRRVMKNDIRFIYVKRLIAVDTTELDDMRNKLETVTKEKNNLHLQLSTLRIKMDEKVAQLTQEIEILRSGQHTQIPNIQSQHNLKNELKYFMDKSLEIHSEGGCRVLDFNPRTNTVAVSMVSPNALFTGFGVRKITLPDYRPTAFIPSHVKAIRDLAFKDNLLLSVSLDTKAKLIDMNTNSEVLSFNCENPLWSCCWDNGDSNVFYVGNARGSVTVHDIRNPGSALTQLEVTGDGSPVVSLAYTNPQHSEVMPLGGLLCCKLNSCWAFEKTQQSTYEPRHLGLEGPFMSLRWNKQTRHMLVSARPNQRMPYTRHIVCELNPGNGDSLICNTVHMFKGAQTQRLLTRSAFFNLDDNVYVAAHHESDRNVTFWSIKTGLKVGSVPAHNPILDLCPVTTNNSSCLATLNEKKLNFFKINKVA